MGPPVYLPRVVNAALAFVAGVRVDKAVAADEAATAGKAAARAAPTEFAAAYRT
jgi:hypothetical protein